jgi:hypothetical protein
MLKSIFLSAAFVSLTSFTLAANAQSAPKIVLKSTELKKVGVNYIGYFNIAVQNFTEFPADMFAPAPTLPPCGLNTNSARTWVNIHDAGTSKYLYGFCALGQPADLQRLWFGLKWGNLIPSGVYIELKDRLTGRTYRSNTLVL